MEKLINNLATKIALELNLDNDNKEVIAYGIFAITQIILSIISIIIFGFIFNVVTEALIISFAGSILRKYSGGAHASSPGNCMVIGTIICVGLAVIFVNLINPLINIKLILLIGVITFITSYYLLYKLAPVDSPGKPIKSQEKIIRMKKGSIIILFIYIIITIVNIMLYFKLRDTCFLVYSLCIYGGTIWQVFTLTKIGHRVLNKIDLFFNIILKFIRRGNF